MYGAACEGSVRYRCHANTESGMCDLNAAGQAELLDAVLGAIETRFNEPGTVERLRVEKVEVWSRRECAGQPYRLEHGVVHLRPDMWLTEAESDKLYRTTRSTA